MARTIFVLSCSVTLKARISSFIRANWVSASLTKFPKKPGTVAEKQTMLINEKKLSMMNPEHRKLLEQEMVNFLFEGKDVHIEGYTPPEQ